MSIVYYSKSKSYYIFTKYRWLFNLVNLFEYEDFAQEYELYKLEHNNADCFDIFCKNVLNKARKRQRIVDDLNDGTRTYHAGRRGKLDNNEC